MFSRQNDAGSRASTIQYWENLVLVSEAKAPYFHIFIRQRLAIKNCVQSFLKNILRNFLKVKKHTTFPRSRASLSSKKNTVIDNDVREIF